MRNFFSGFSAFGAFAATLLLGSSAFGAGTPRVGAEVDPLPFFRHGYSVHAEWKPAARWRFTFGAFGYRFEPKGDNEGFSTRLDALEGSVGLFPLHAKDRGFFASACLFEQRFRYRRDGVPGEARRHWLTPALAIGYQFLPWNAGPYLTAWAALGVPVVRTGETDVGNERYKEPKIVPVLAIHVGGEVELP